LSISYGWSALVVFRIQLGENNQHHWQLIGEEYVYRFMDVEGISSLSLKMLESEEVEFEI
jgi:hypothetical protein